ncbi:hypothetical protein SNE40_022631 [Patella caerulea]|uniref:Uncharacterized protein n=1 Tax=Patella caerulea TaxID=87958 RepID=A0AAN8G5U0_PATCE
MDELSRGTVLSDSSGLFDSPEFDKPLSEVVYDDSKLFSIKVVTSSIIRESVAVIDKSSRELPVGDEEADGSSLLSTKEDSIDVLFAVDNPTQSLINNHITLHF